MVGDVLDQEQDVLDYKNFDSKSLQKRAHSKTSIVKMQISEKWR